MRHSSSPARAMGLTRNRPRKILPATYLVITPACANPGDTIQVEGFNFPANASGPLRFVPGSEPGNTVTLGRETVETDSEGHFIGTMVLPERPAEEVQYIRVSPSRNVGAPRFSQSAKDTWDKIVETVFLALLATVAGTVIAIPLSFLAARNLMKPVKSPLLSISLSLLGWPAGIAVGLVIVRWVESLSSLAGTNIWINLASFVACRGAAVLCPALVFAPGRGCPAKTPHAHRTPGRDAAQRPGRLLWFVPAGQLHEDRRIQLASCPGFLRFPGKLPVPNR